MNVTIGPIESIIFSTLHKNLLPMLSLRVFVQQESSMYLGPQFLFFSLAIAQRSFVYSIVLHTTYDCLYPIVRNKVYQKKDGKKEHTEKKREKKREREIKPCSI